MSRLNTHSSGAPIDDLKIPPQSIEAEQAVLGGLLIAGDAWEEVADRLSESDFYRYDHGLIFRALSTLSSNNSPCDVITVSQWLESSGLLEEVGGMVYLASLARETPSAANIRAYADIVREQAILRDLIKTTNEVNSLCYRPEGRTAQEVLEQAESSIFAIAEQGARGQQGFRELSEYIKEASDRIEELYELKGEITGLTTGFKNLDSKTSGLQPADLVIVAARPSMGKTTFAMNIAETIALKQDKAVAVFSMEMPGESLALRMLSSMGRIDQSKIRNGQLEDEDWPRLVSAMTLLNKAKLFIDDTGGLSPSDLRARCRRLSRRHPLGLIIVDYLQLMSIPGTRENRTNEISEISRSLKMLAREMNVPVIALSQLNRSLETRTDRRPIMSDLRESGAIEQDADLILFIYRDEVYNPNSVDAGTAEIIIGKQRNGPTGRIRLTFLGQYLRFENYIADEVYRGDM